MIVFSINSFVAFAAFYKHSVFPLVSFDKSGISIARYLYQRKKITYGSPGVSVSIENGRVSFWQDEVRLLNFSLFGVSKEDVCLIMSEIERGFPVHKPNTQSKV